MPSRQPETVDPKTYKRKPKKKTRVPQPYKSGAQWHEENKGELICELQRAGKKPPKK